MSHWTPEMKSAAMKDAAKVCEQAKRIAELVEALRTAQRRFELLAVISDEIVNGVRPSVGAAECAAAIRDAQ